MRLLLKPDLFLHLAEDKPWQELVTLIKAAKGQGNEHPKKKKANSRIQMNIKGETAQTTDKQALYSCLASALKS